MQPTDDWQVIAALWSAALTDDELAAFVRGHGGDPGLATGPHARDAEAWMDLASLERAMRRLGPTVVLAGLERVGERHPQIRQRARWLVGAIAPHAEDLREEPAALASVVHNYLRGFAGRVDALASLRWPAHPWLGLIVRLRADATDVRSDAELRCRLRMPRRYVERCRLLDGEQRALFGYHGRAPLELWDLTTGELVRQFVPAAEEPDERVDWLVTPDERWLVVCGRDARKHRFVVRELASGRVVRTFGLAGDVSAIEPGLDSRSVLVIADPGVTLWDLERGRRISAIGESPRLGLQHGLTVRRTTDGRWLFVKSWKGLHRWDIGARHYLGRCQLPGTPSLVAALDETRVLMRETGRFSLYDARDGSLLGSLDAEHSELAAPGGALRLVQGHMDVVVRDPSGEVVAVERGSSTRDGRLLIYGPGEVHVWAPQRGHAPVQAEPPMLEGHRGAVFGCAVTPDGRSLVSASEGSVLLWSRAGGRPRPWQPVGMPALECVVLPDGERVACRSARHLSLRALASGEVLASLERGQAELELEPSGRCFAVRTVGSLQLGDLGSLRPLGPALAIEPDAAWCPLPAGEAAIVDRHGLYRVAVADGALVDRLDPPAQVGWLLGSPGGRLVASGGGDGVVSLWSLADRSRLELSGFRGGAHRAWFSADERWLLVSAGLGSVRAWDLRSCAPGPVYVEDDGLRKVFAVSPDGGRVVVAGGNIVKVFELETGLCIHTVFGRGWFTAVAAMNGVIVAGERDGEVWLLAEHGRSPA